MSLVIRALIAALSLLLWSPLVSAQAAEAEANDTCPTAQDFGAVGLPFSVEGSLDSSPEQPDIDFFRFVGVPGDTVQVDLEGASTGMGSLTDPYLGLFSSSCELLAASDDFGGTLNSRLLVSVPPDGVYVLAATACCDSAFTGGGIGSYRLTVSQSAAVDSIAGRIVDADTFAPLPGDAPPFAFVQLNRCYDSGCWEFVNYASANSGGEFQFTADLYGFPLAAGSYQVSAWANGYNTFFSEPFEVVDGEARYLGDLPLTRFAVIGAVTARIVDADDGSPLPGTSPPYALVELRRCEASECYPVVALFADEFGRVRFEGAVWGLSTGTYVVFAYADDYQPAESVPFDVGDGIEVDAGDVALKPLPIRFGEVTGCEVLPIGGTCDFSIAITKRGAGGYRGGAWAIVDYFPNQWPYRSTRFQVGRGGADQPSPQRFVLRQGDATTLGFQLQLPPNVPAGSSVCVGANVGRYPSPQFNSAGERFLFCAVADADGLRRLSDKEGRRHLRKLSAPGN